MESGKRISLPRYNRSLILHILHEEGVLSRVDIAERMKLTKTTVTLLTNEMLEKGVLCERGMRPTKQHLSRGRRKILLDINENYKLVFGAVLERDHIVLGLTNLKGQALDKSKTSVEGKSYREVLETLVAQLEYLMQSNCITSEKILGLGVTISPNAGAFMEEVAHNDKAMRIRKDLSHALSFPVVSDTTISGALLAQQLFSQQRPFLLNLLMLRYGDQIENAVLANGKEYMTANKTAGGFALMQKTEQGDTYQEYQLQIEQSQQEEALTNQLNVKLARDIAVCCSVLDPDKIYAFGGYFEQEARIEQINSILRSQWGIKNMLTRSVINEAAIYLSPCATAISRIFYENDIFH